MERGHFIRKKHSPDCDHGGCLHINPACLSSADGDTCVGVWWGSPILFRCVEQSGNDITWAEDWENSGVNIWSLVNIVFKKNKLCQKPLWLMFVAWSFEPFKNALLFKINQLVNLGHGRRTNPFPDFWPRISFKWCSMINCSYFYNVC